MSHPVAPDPIEMSDPWSLGGNAFLTGIARIVNWIKGLSPSGTTEYDTDWITLRASAPTIQVRRVGKIVYVRIDGNGNVSLPNNANTTIQAGVIPVEYRPDYHVRTGCWLGNSFGGILLVTMSGDVIIGNSSGATRTFVNGTASWVLA